ncbi:FAR1-related protein [Trifolium pratense]|uniref:FAR1-related protein n=1 Tax=Trifolium pratense TaxID=57577 RepID=A0A2K3NGA2_TRIPR|nr:FAR1-related protein [Trifolium pratense]
MDATYKTNGYNMPLFEIVGVMSTEKTFGVGFAFLIFPSSAALAYHYHIIKNVTTRFKTYCKIKYGENVKHSDVVKSVMDCFEDLLDSPTEEEYDEPVLKFRRVCEM